MLKKKTGFLSQCQTEPISLNYLTKKNLDLNYLKNINCDWYDLKDSFTCYKVTRYKIIIIIINK